MNMKKMNKIPSSVSSPNLKEIMINGKGSSDNNAFPAAATAATTIDATTDVDADASSSISTNNYTPIPFSKRFDSFGSSHERSKSFRSMDQQQQQQQQQRFSRSNSPSLRQRRSSCDTTIQQQSHQHHHQVLKEKIIIPVNDIAKVHIHNHDDDGKNTKKNTKRKSSSNSNTNTTTKNEEQNYKRTIGITTASSGWYYEFIMESMNEQLVLITFLKVNSLSTSSTTKVMAATTGGGGRNKPNIEFVPLLKHHNHNHNNQDGTATRSAADISNIHKYGDSSSSNNVTNNNSTNDNTATTTTTTTGVDGDNDNDNYIDLLNRSIESNPSNLTQTTQQSNKSLFDVETFTAKRMKERLKRDTISEKVERRMHRFISSLEELSNTFNKCACGCLYDDEDPTSTAVAIVKSAVISSSLDKNSHGGRSRRNTASTVSSSDNQNNDIDDDDQQHHQQQQQQPVTMTTTNIKYEFGSGSLKKRQDQEELMRYAQIPSGLSVESPSEDDYSYSSGVVDILHPVRILTRDI